MNNLEYWRIKRGMSQTELAEKSGVMQPEISKVEKGVKDLKGAYWVSLANVLDCTTDELLGKLNAERG